MTPDLPETRRLTITLRKWPLSLTLGVRPTIVIEGRGQPTQWGEGTWQLPADREATVAVYLFTRLWRYGVAEIALAPGETGPLEYRAPWLPFLAGRLRRA